MNTYIIPNAYAKSFTMFVELEDSINNVEKVTLYWHKTEGLKAIAKLQNKDEFVFTFCNMTIESARNLKNRLFKHLCENNKNYSVTLK